MNESIDPNQINDKELDVPSYYEREQLKEGIESFKKDIQKAADDRKRNAKDNFKKHIFGE